MDPHGKEGWDSMIAALYARVSTADQDPENQLIRLRAYAASHNWLTAEYIDVASGANQHRPGMDQMLKDCKARGIKIILATKLDRLTRSLINLYDMLDKLDKAGVQVIFLDQPINTADSSGRLMLNILACMAEFERDLIRERTNDGLARAAAQGRHGGRPKRELSAYQIKRAEEILARNPQISQRELCAQFNGISRSTLLKLLRERGLIA